MKSSIIYLLLIISFFSCSDKKNITQYKLEETTEQIIIPIDSNTKLFSRSMHHFTDTTGIEYLTIENTETTDSYYYINFYRLDSCVLSHRVKIEKEGPNGIPRMMGHGVIDLDHIFISAFNRPLIYQINKQGIIMNKYDFSKTDDGLITTGTDFNSLIYKPLIIQNHKIFCMQYPMPPNCDGEQLKKTPLTVTIDTISKEVKASKLCYPELWSKGDGMGLNPHCSRIFDGKRFIYAFRMSHDLLVTEDHIKGESITAKSQYIDDLQTEGFSNKLSFSEFNKLASEQACYGNIIYDPYKNIYYRFVYPKCKIDSMDPEYVFCRKEFSIMILDENFNVLGETLFPAGKYVPALFFVNEKGLFLSVNNTSNPQMTDDKLVFQCLHPVANSK